MLSDKSLSLMRQFIESFVDDTNRIGARDTYNGVITTSALLIDMIIAETMPSVPKLKKDMFSAHIADNVKDIFDYRLLINSEVGRHDN